MDGSAIRVLVIGDCADAAGTLAALAELWGYEALVDGVGG